MKLWYSYREKCTQWTVINKREGQGWGFAKRFPTLQRNMGASLKQTYLSMTDHQMARNHDWQGWTQTDVEQGNKYSKWNKAKNSANPRQNKSTTNFNNKIVHSVVASPIGIVFTRVNQGFKTQSIALGLPVHSKEMEDERDDFLVANEHQRCRQNGLQQLRLEALEQANNSLGSIVRE